MNLEEREFQETLELLREVHREPIAEAHYAAVRAGVLSRLAARPAWWRGNWRYGFAAAALAMLLITFWSKHPPVGPALPPASRTLDQAEVAGPLPARRPELVESTHASGKRLPHHAGAASVAYRVIGPPASQPLMVKLVTNDPNVVIYWISGE